MDTERYNIIATRGTAPGVVIDLSRDLPGTIVDVHPLVRVISAELTEEQAFEIASDPRVSSVEPEVQVVLSSEWKEQVLTNRWHLDRITKRSVADMDGKYPWKREGKGVRVYIVDTGIRQTHEEFIGRTASGYSTVGGSAWEDLNGHGTAVAAMAVGVTVGPARGATLVSVRCTNTSTFPSGEAAEGLDWILGNHPDGTPGVVNLSMTAEAGGTSANAIVAAVESLYDAGLTVVCASGNDGIDVATRVPAKMPESITVAKSNNADAHTSSNSGEEITLYAPGHAVTTASNTSDTAYGSVIGSSYSSPLVAGVAAQALEANPYLRPAEVKNLIVEWATPDVMTSVPAGTPNLLLYGLEASKWMPANVIRLGSDYIGQWYLGENFMGKVNLGTMRIWGIDEEGDLVEEEPTPQETYEDEVLADSPAAYWPMNEGTGDPQDASGNGQHLSLFAGAPTWVTTDDLWGTVLDGTSGDWTTTQRAPQAAYTLEAWVRLLNTPNVEATPVGDWGGTGAWGVMLVLMGGRTMRVYHRGAYLTTPTFSSTDWHHVVATWDGAIQRLYVDGELYTSRTETAAPGNGSASRVSGYGNLAGMGVARRHNNRMAHIAWYPTALSSERVASHYATGYPQENDPSVVYAYDDVSIDTSSQTVNALATGAPSELNTSLFLAAYGHDWNRTSYTRHSLMRFDLTEMTSTPTSVKLRVTRSPAAPAPSSGNALQVREMLQEYVANEVTWQQYAAGQPWGLAGARSDGTDRGVLLSPLGAGSPAVGESLEVDVTELVVPMIGTTAKLLATYLTGNNGLRAYRSNAVNKDHRPALLFEW